MLVKNKNTDEMYLFNEDKKTIELLKNATKSKMNTKTKIWFMGVLLISTGVGLMDYRGGLVVGGLLLLLTVMMCD